MKNPYIDLAQAPIIRVNFNASVHTAELKEILEEFDRFYASNNDPFALILDCSESRPARTGARQLLTEHEARWKSYKQKCCAAQAIVIVDPLIRGIVQAVFWVTPAGYPLRTFSNVADAHAWVSKLFRERRREVFR